MGLQNRQSLRTDSCESGTPPHSHGLAKMWSDLAMVWRSPAQSHSALFLPRFYCQYIFCPPTPSLNPPILGILFQAPSVPSPYPTGVLCLQPSLCTGISADGLHSPPFSSQPVCITFGHRKGPMVTIPSRTKSGLHGSSISRPWNTTRQVLMLSTKTS